MRIASSSCQNKATKQIYMITIPDGISANRDSAVL